MVKKKTKSRLHPKNTNIFNRGGNEPESIHNQEAELRDFWLFFF